MTVRTKTTIENKTSETTERHTHSLYCLGVATIWVFFFILLNQNLYHHRRVYFLDQHQQFDFTCFDSYVRLRKLQRNRITDLSRIATSGIEEVYEL